MKVRYPLAPRFFVTTGVVLIAVSAAVAASSLASAVDRPAGRAAVDLIGALRSESDPERLSDLTQRIIESRSAVRDRSVVEAAVQLLETDPVPERRRGALAVLTLSSDVNQDLIGHVSAASRSDSDPHVRTAAVLTLAAWMNGRPALVEPISRDLLETARATPDGEAHILALQAIALLDSGVPEDVLRGMADALRSESDPGVRAITALALGAATGESRAFALRELELAYQRETDLDTRRNLITQMVRVATSEAAPVLERLPSDDPLTTQDIRDYVEILQSGATDPLEIYRTKSLRDDARGTFVGADHHDD